MSRTRIAVLLGILLAVVLGLRENQARLPVSVPEPAPAREPAPDLPAAARARYIPALLAPFHAATVPALVAISGRVIIATTGDTVSGAEVIARGGLGESSATTAADGTFSLAVAPGEYRLAVRGAGVTSAGHTERVRLDAGPTAVDVAAPDERVMPTISAHADVGNVELAVWRESVIEGAVVDEAGVAVAHAFVRADGMMKPALGTDVAETDERGHFVLRVPANSYGLEARHGGLVTVRAREVHATHDVHDVVIVMASACEISGRVVRADGTPAGDGAIERGLDGGFEPAGRVEADGSFRWIAAPSDRDVTLRAWPWKSPPTRAQTFACGPGARFDHVELRLPDAAPDLAGTIVDASGAPVPFAYLDIEALDPGNPSQQERADADGRWEIFEMPRGSYHITATAAGLGVATATVAAPSAGTALVLSGTGRIEGRAAGIARGTLIVSFVECGDLDRRAIALAREPRLVEVVNERFVVDGVPACEALGVSVVSRDRATVATVAVSAGGTALLHVDL